MAALVRDLNLESLHGAEASLEQLLGELAYQPIWCSLCAVRSFS